MPKPSTKEAGNKGEEIARKYLQNLGMSIVETNYHYSKYGEIDIIARDGDVLVFCEVKMRMNDEYGDPEFAVTQRKQAQIRKIAEAYLWERDIDNQECRFDVVAIKAVRGTQEINYIPDAF